MKYYKDSQNHVYAFKADGSQDDYINPSLISISKTEADELSNPPPSLADLRVITLRTIATSCDAEINAVKAGYPESEILTWDKQETEARAFIADAQAATPLLDALSVAREIAKAELAARVIAKADAFAAYTGALIGKRQKLEDQMAALFADPENPPTAEQIEAVQWVTEAPQP